MQIKRVKVISMNIKICIATQKKYRLPDDDIYPDSGRSQGNR